MRNMSFSLTTAQIKVRTKTVTRRLGWKNLKSGELFQACEKCMGLKPGQKIVRLVVLRCISNQRERLTYLIANPRYGKAEARKEGFPQLSGRQFVAMFCQHMKVDPDHVVNRIEFEYVEKESPVANKEKRPGMRQRTFPRKTHRSKNQTICRRPVN